jgi:Family of unknown function (DUF6166)
MMLPSRQRTYYGFDDGKGAIAVFVSAPGRQMMLLPLCCDIVNHSPTGFAWGYAGSGPAQLALAILADYFGCAHAARALHQLFKFAAISGIHEKHWSMAGSDIAATFEKLCRDRPWLDRLAILDEGPAVQIVDRYAERSGEFGRLPAVIPHDESEANDELVLVLADNSEVTLYRDQVSAVPLHSGLTAR